MCRGVACCVFSTVSKMLDLVPAPVTLCLNTETSSKVSNNCVIPLVAAQDTAVLPCSSCTSTSEALNDSNINAQKPALPFKYERSCLLASALCRLLPANHIAAVLPWGSVASTQSGCKYNSERKPSQSKSRAARKYSGGHGKSVGACSIGLAWYCVTGFGVVGAL